MTHRMKLVPLMVALITFATGSHATTGVSSTFFNPSFPIDVCEIDPDLCSDRAT